MKTNKLTGSFFTVGCIHDNMLKKWNRKLIEVAPSLTTLMSLVCVIFYVQVLSGEQELAELARVSGFKLDDFVQLN